MVPAGGEVARVRLEIVPQNGSKPKQQASIRHSTSPGLPADNSEAPQCRGSTRAATVK